jgi:hypothetical protein
MHLREIVIGPGEDPNDAEERAKEFLTSVGYHIDLCGNSVTPMTRRLPSLAGITSCGTAMCDSVA